MVLTVSAIIVYALSKSYDTIAVVMILRVYALFNRSRVILRALLVMYAMEIIIFIVYCSLSVKSNYAQGKHQTESTDPFPPLRYSVIVFVVPPILDISACSFTIITQTLFIVMAISQFILSVMLFVLVVTQFLRGAFQMHRATQKWEFNRYVNLLIREGLLYFLVYVEPVFPARTMIHNMPIRSVFNNLVNLLGNFRVQTAVVGWSSQLLFVIANVPLYILTPRFVLNIRELYMLDSQGRLQRDIDTGFGLSSGAGHGVGISTTIGTIAFAQPSGSREPDDGDGIVVVDRAESSGRQALV